MKAEDNPFPYLTLAEQGSAPSTPASGKALVYRKTDNHLYMKDDAGAETQLDGSSSSGSGGVLAYTAYNPGSLSSYTTTSTTAADVDSTNLAVTFTAPSSGKVLVRLSALCGISGTAVNFFWALRESTTTVGATQTSGFASSTVNLFLSVPIVVTGLTASSSYTYKWAWYVNSSGSPTARMYAGTGAGQAVMEVLPLP